MAGPFRMRVAQRSLDGRVGAAAIDVKIDCSDVAGAREVARLNPVTMFLEGGNYAWVTDGDDQTVWSLKLEEG